MRLRAAVLSVAAALLLSGAAAPAPCDAAQPRIAIGVYLPNQWKNPTLLDAYAKQVGQMPAIVLSYKRWDVKPFYPPELRQIDSRGAVPLVSWEPWKSDGKAATLWAIARGRFDRYVERSARQARAWGKPIMLRFAQEMNGNWAPWEKGKRGSTPLAYVKAWRHLVAVFRRVGANNVKWVWCPNVNTGHLPFLQYYPGDSWVDWVGLDGFNWGGSIGWRSISEVFAGSYETLTRRTGKPMIIAETGSGQSRGNKAEWVRSAFRRELPHFDRVRAVVWYDARDRSDFRVNSSPSALKAFREGVSLPLYQGDRAELLATPTALKGPVPPISIPDGDYGAPSALKTLWHKALDRIGAAVWILLGVILLAGVVGGAFILRRRSATPRHR